MGALDQLTTTQKIMGAGGLGLVGILFLMRKGASEAAGNGGVVIADVRRPTDDMNTPGADWGSDGYQYFNEMNTKNMELLRYIWGQQGKTPGNTTTPPTVPVDPGADPFNPVRVGRGNYQMDDGTVLRSGRGVQDNFIVRGPGDVITRGNVSRGVWNSGRALLGLDPIEQEAWRRARRRDQPMGHVNPQLPNSPTPRPPDNTFVGQ